MGKDGEEVGGDLAVLRGGGRVTPLSTRAELFKAGLKNLTHPSSGVIVKTPRVSASVIFQKEEVEVNLNRAHRRETTVTAAVAAPRTSDANSNRVGRIRSN